MAKIEVFSFWTCLYIRSFGEFRKRIAVFLKNPFCGSVDDRGYV